MNHYLSHPLARTRLMPGLIAVLGIFAQSPSSAQRLPGLVQTPEVAMPPAKTLPQKPSSAPPVPTQKATDTQYGHGYTNVPNAAARKIPSTAPSREPTEQEERRSTEEWYAQLNEAAATGEIVYLARLLDATHGHRGDPAMAKSGLGKARDAGSRLAGFLYAAFDYNTAAKESVHQTQAIEVIKTLKGYAAADYWLAEKGIAPATTDPDTKRKNAEAVLGNVPNTLANTSWLQAHLSDDISSLDDEFRYAQLMAACGAWEYAKSRTCPRVTETAWRRPHSMAVKPGDQPKRVTDRWLGEWRLTNSGTLQAPMTGLEWMPCVLGETWNGSQQNCVGSSKAENITSAPAAVREFNSAGGFGGHSDWRLPTVEDLHTISYCKGSTRIAMRTHGGGEVQKACINTKQTLEADVRRDLFPRMPLFLVAARTDRRDSLMSVRMNGDFYADALGGRESYSADVLLVRKMK